MTTHPAPLVALPSDGHDHAVGLDATLDFVNTLQYDDGVPRERLRDAEDVASFLDDLGVAHGDAVRADAAAARDRDAWLGRVRDLRAALREVFDAQVEGRAPGGEAIAALNAALAARPRPELRATPAGIAVGHHHAADATGEGLARLAEPFVEAIASGEAARFRVCANDGCRWVFRDTSRAGRRRWCDMSSCGNRAKAARYRSRHRAAG